MNKIILKRLTLKITGNVQGVFYRLFIWNYIQNCNKLLDYGITGKIENVGDKDVSAVLEGEEEKLEKILGFFYVSSPVSRVEKITEEWDNIDEREFPDFDRY